jgi:hypothetical protein
MKIIENFFLLLTSLRARFPLLLTIINFHYQLPINIDKLLTTINVDKLPTTDC